ncbi:hypothetical protein Tco_1201095 [Tanacetum coccineum]
METCNPVGTPMEIKDKLDLDQNGTLVDATKYQSMIGALMYLTSSRPDIVHATCLCARYQAKPTEKHLKEVKRIFRYLRGTVNMGLWYTKDSGFKLTGFSDADYARCKESFKSTSSGTQFLGEKLVSWSSKNQNRRDFPMDTPLDRIEVLRVILFSIHNDEWKSFQSQHQTALRTSKYSESNASALDDPTLQAGNPVKEILLKLNLHDHRSQWEAEELKEIQDGDTSPSENTSKIPMEVEGFEPPQEEVVPIRRSVRTHRAPNRLCLNVKVKEHSLGDLNEPTNYKAAILDPEYVGKPHWTAVKTILKYLKNIKDIILVYGGNPKAKLRVNCYCNAGFETNRDDIKSLTRYVSVLNRGVVDWKSSKQSTAAMSAT